MTSRPWHLTARFFGHSCPIDPVIGKMEREEFGARTDPVDALPTIDRDACAVHHSAPDGRSQIERIAIAKQLAAHHRANAVRADEEVASHRTLLKSDLDVVFGLLEAVNVGAKSQRTVVELGREGGLQVGTRDKSNVRAVPLRNDVHRDLHELMAAPA